jgi:hypothetical protein
MNDDLNDLEQALTRHRLAAPPPALRSRIVASACRSTGIWWQGIAAAILAVLALLQILLSGAAMTPPSRAPSDEIAFTRQIRELNLPLDDSQTRLLADNLAAGARLTPLPEIHGKPVTQLGEIP